MELIFEKYYHSSLSVKYDEMSTGVRSMLPKFVPALRRGNRLCSDWYIIHIGCFTPHIHQENLPNYEEYREIQRFRSVQNVSNHTVVVPNTQADPSTDPTTDPKMAQEESL